MITPVQYMRRALYVEAVRVTEENFEELCIWCHGDIVEASDKPGLMGKKHIRIRVHTPKNYRQTMAFVGDWILYTDKGYKIYSNSSFIDNFILAVNEDNKEVKA